MNYTKQVFYFKIKKLLRYFRLYGLRRTLVKINGQYHMKKEYNNLPKIKLKFHSNKSVGLIGCGNFPYSNIAYYLTKNYGKIIRCSLDLDVNKAASIYEKYNLDYYTTDVEKILNDDSIKLLYIASNHSTHAEYAIKAIDRGKAVHIEKPHVVSQSQLISLCRAINNSNSKVNLGFNRPNSRFGKIIFEHIKNEKGSSIINWFIAGHELAPDHWYFKKKEGGRILGNLSHWTDFTLLLIPQENRYPIKIIPTRYDKPDSNIVVSYIFGDGSISTISFSAKGHTFEGVREKFNMHKGNLLISLDDYEKLRIDNFDKKKLYKNFYRDHGHQATIKNSYRMINEDFEGHKVKYIWETGELFLKTKEALDNNTEIIIEKGYNEEKLNI